MAHAATRFADLLQLHLILRLALVTEPPRLKGWPWFRLCRRGVHVGERLVALEPAAAAAAEPRAVGGSLRARHGDALAAERR